MAAGGNQIIPRLSSTVATTGGSRLRKSRPQRREGAHKPLQQPHGGQPTPGVSGEALWAAPQTGDTARGYGVCCGVQGRAFQYRARLVLGCLGDQGQRNEGALGRITCGNTEREGYERSQLHMNRRWSVAA